MKNQIRKTWIAVLVAVVALCSMMAIMFASTLPQAKADGIALGETKFSVSSDESKILFATPIACSAEELATIYEVGYTFDGDQDAVSGNKYYTSLVTGGNTLTALDIFGDTYTETTPMIIGEVDYVAGTVLNATAYYKKGTMVEGTLYKDHNGVPDVAVQGKVKNTKVYEDAKIAADVQAFVNDYKNGIVLENVATMSAKITAIDAKIATLDDTSAITDLDKYNEIKSSFVVIDDMTGNVGERFTVTGATATKNTDHATYGKVLTITQSGNFSVKWNNPNSMDLSGYDRIIVGVRNGTASAFDANFTHTDTTVHTLHKAIPASMAETDEYKLIIMSVSEFLTYGIKTNATAGDISFTNIVAVKGVAADVKSLKASTGFFDNVKVSDFKVLEDMIDENFASRVSYTDTGLFANTVKSTWSSYFYLSNGTANFGRAAAGLLGPDKKLTFKVNGVTADDLAGFTYVGTIIRNGTGLSITVPGYEIPMGQTKMVLISVADYLANGIVVSSPAGNSSGTYSIGAIFAVNMPQ